VPPDVFAGSPPNIAFPTADEAAGGSSSISDELLDALDALPGLPHAVLDPSVLSQLLTPPVTGIAITGLLGLLTQHYATGIPPADFVRPVLEPCASSVRTVIRAVKLVPSSASAWTGAADAGSANRPVYRGHAHSRDSEPISAGIGGTALAPNSWRIPNANDLLLRIVGAVLAALTALVAGVGGARHEQRAGQLRRYRRRLHS
jgi:hypothetical protein